MQIRILKSDGHIEPYLHTKVLGSFNQAMAGMGDCLYAAEQMAEAVTFYLYRQVRHGTLSADDIHQMIVTARPRPPLTNIGSDANSSANASMSLMKASGSIPPATHPSGTKTESSTTS